MQLLVQILSAFLDAHSRLSMQLRFCIDQTSVEDGLRVLPVNVMACSGWDEEVGSGRSQVMSRLYRPRQSLGSVRKYIPITPLVCMGALRPPVLHAPRPWTGKIQCSGSSRFELRSLQTALTRLVAPGMESVTAVINFRNPTAKRARLKLRSSRSAT